MKGKTKALNHDVQSVFLLFRSFMITSQIAIDTNKDPHYPCTPHPGQKLPPTWENHHVAWLLDMFWMFCFDLDGRRRCDEFLDKEVKRQFIFWGPKYSLRWYERLLLKPFWILGSPKVEWFWRPTDAWKQQVEELIAALKAIPLSEYMELSFLLEDAFGFDLSWERGQYPRVFQSKLYSAWLCATCQDHPPPGGLSAFSTFFKDTMRSKLKTNLKEVVDTREWTTLSEY